MNELISNIKWLLGLALIGKFSWFLLLFLVAGIAGAEQYGVLILYLTVWLIMGRAAGLGLDIWVNREVSINQEPNYRSHVGSRALFLRTILVGFTGLIAVLIASRLTGSIGINLLWFALCGLRQLAESIKEIQIGIVQGHQRMAAQSKALVPVELAQLIAIGGLIYILDIDSVTSMIACLTLFSWMKVVALSIALRTINFQFTSSKLFSPVLVKSCFTSSATLGVAVLLPLIIAKADVILLRLFTNSSVVGNYAIAYLVIESIDALMGTVRQSIFPRLSWASKHNIAKYKRLVRSVVLITLLMAAISGSAILTLNSFAFPKTLFENFSQASAYLNWLVCGLIFLMLSGSLGAANISAGRYKSVVGVQLIGIGINLVANCMLIPLYGGMGAVISTIFTYIAVDPNHWTAQG